MGKPAKRKMNQDITAEKVFVINHDGEKLGELSIYEALRRAEEGQMDLVEVGPGKDGVSVCKIMDQGKEAFKKKKNQQKGKSGGKVMLKTLRISYKMAEHDMEIRRKHAEKFANQHHLLKIELLLRGRERRFTDEAKEKLQSFAQSLAEFYTTNGEVKVAGNRLSVDLKPVTKKKKEEGA